MVLEKVIELIEEYKDEGELGITSDSTFEELSLDSLDTVELVMNLEAEFDVTIEVTEDIKTVGDIVKIIESEME